MVADQGGRIPALSGAVPVSFLCCSGRVLGEPDSPSIQPQSTIGGPVDNKHSLSRRSKRVTRNSLSDKPLPYQSDCSSCTVDSRDPNVTTATGRYQQTGNDELMHVSISSNLRFCFKARRQSPSSISNKDSNELEGRSKMRPTRLIR